MKILFSLLLLFLSINIATAKNYLQCGYSVSDQLNKYDDYNYQPLKSWTSGINDDGSIIFWPPSNKDYPLPAYNQDFKSIVSNNISLAALTEDGHIKVFGEASQGGSGQPTTSGWKVIQSIEGKGFVALHNDGYLAYWGRSSGVLPSGNDFVDVFVSQTTATAVRADGSVVVWGAGAGQTAAPSDTGFINIVGSYNGFAGMKADGTVKSWGYTGSVPAEVNNCKKIKGGKYAHICLTQDGHLVPWGHSNSTILRNPPTDGGYVDVFANSINAIGLKADGSVTTWGTIARELPPNNMKFIKIVVSYTAITGLTADGQVHTWGALNAGAGEAPTHGGFIDVSSVNGGFSALRKDGSVEHWNSRDMVSHPNPPSLDDSFVKINTNLRAQVAFRADNSFYLWNDKFHTDERSHQPEIPTSAGWKIMGSNADTPDFCGTIPNFGNRNPWITTAQGGTYNGVGLFEPYIEVGKTSVLDINAWDFEDGRDESLHFSLHGVDAALFNIDTLGKLSLISPAIANKEYHLRVVVEDSGGLTDTLTLVVKSLRNEAYSGCGHDYNTDRNLRQDWKYHDDRRTGMLNVDGSITAWGPTASTNKIILPVPNKDFIEVIANGTSLIAIRKDGSIYDASTGDSSPPLGTGWYKVLDTTYAYVALNNNGDIATWGSSSNDIVTNFPADDTSGYVDIYTGANIAAALKEDGSITSWYSSNYAYSAPTDKGYTHIVAGQSSMVAVKADGSLVTWGYTGYTPSEAKNCKVLQGAHHGFFCLTQEGRIIGWGSNLAGSIFQDMPTDSGYVKILSGESQAVALKADGSIAMWGSGATLYPPPANVKFKKVYSNQNFFAGVTLNDRVITWGSPNPHPRLGGKVKQVVATMTGFGILFEDGSIFSHAGATTSSHGGRGGTGDPGVHGLGFISMASTNSGFIAIRQDGSFATWSHALDYDLVPVGTKGWISMNGVGLGDNELNCAMENVVFTLDTVDGQIGSPITSSTQTPAIAGQCTDDGVVTAYIDGIAITPTTICTNGKYTIIPDTPLSVAQHIVTTKEVFQSGGVAEAGPVVLIIEAGQCAVSGASNPIGIAVQGTIKTDDQIIIPSTVDSPVSGHLKAYKIKEDGSLSTTAVWDAAQKMTISSRANKLLTTDANQQLLKIDQLTKELLSVSSAFKSQIIKSYTLNPSYDGGEYLAGRAQNSLIGNLSRGNQVSLVDNKPNTMQYLQDAGYRTFSKTYVSERKKQVLLTSDDGFLYSIDYDSGVLNWGWMPPAILPYLDNYQSFQGRHTMSGALYTIDAKDDNGAYQSYIVGSYQSGLGHYILQYDKSKPQTNELKKVVSDQYYSTYKKGVMNGAKAFFKDAQGESYVLYSLINNDDQTVLRIQSIADNHVDYTIILNSLVSSKPVISDDYHSRYAPVLTSLYLGTENGNILSAPLLTATGSVASQATLQSLLSAPIISTTALSNLPVEPIQFLGLVKGKNNYWLRSQTSEQLTLFAYDSSQQKWLPRWTSFADGAGLWDKTGAYQSIGTTKPSILNGHPIVPQGHRVQSLPVDAVISDEAFIVAGNIVLPLYISGPVSCQAYYFFFSLADGVFPVKGFTLTSGVALSHHLHLGAGEATRLSLADKPSMSQLIGYASVDQNTDGSVGVPETFIINDDILTGVRSWRVIE